MDTVLYPIEVVVAWIMTGIHSLLMMLGMSDGPGLAWVLSIVGLTIVVRILLIPLLFRQIKAMRGMQEIQPELQKLQKKYKGKKDTASQMAMQEEMKELYKSHGTSPFASCLPILLQMPIFFALFRVLNSLRGISEGTYSREAIGPITQNVAADIENSSIFGANLSDWFLMPNATVETRVVTVLLIVAMSATSFITQKQLTMKNMSQAALEGPLAQQQKIMLYMFPVIFAISGVNFPVGVLIYWTMSNLWSMGQQWYTIRNHPAKGSQAHREMIARENVKREKKGQPLLDQHGNEIDPNAPVEEPKGQRVQPRRKERGGYKGEVVEQPEIEDEDVEDGPVRGKDGLTDEERARKRYERRAAERAAARKKRERRQQGKK